METYSHNNLDKQMYKKNIQYNFQENWCSQKNELVSLTIFSTYFQIHFTEFRHISI